MRSEVGTPQADSTARGERARSMFQPISETAGLRAAGFEPSRADCRAGPI